MNRGANKATLGALAKLSCHIGKKKKKDLRHIIIVIQKILHVLYSPIHYAPSHCFILVSETVHLSLCFSGRKHGWDTGEFCWLRRTPSSCTQTIVGLLHAP